MTASVRLTAARAALHQLVAIYKPLHVAVTEDFSRKFDLALFELESAAVEAQQPPQVVQSAPVFDDARFHTRAPDAGKGPVDEGVDTPPVATPEAADAAPVDEAAPISKSKRKSK